MNQPAGQEFDADRDRGTRSSIFSGRSAWLDLGRCFSAIMVVWIHANKLPGTGYAGRFAVPFFTLAAIVMAVRSAQSQSLRTYVPKRVLRIGLPWVAWSTLYIALPIGVLGVARTQPSFGLLIRGGSYHLWFLPCILVMSVLAFAVSRGIRQFGRHVPLSVIAVLLTVIALAFHLLLIWMHFEPDQQRYAGLSMWIPVFADTLVGLGLAHLYLAFPAPVPSVVEAIPWIFLFSVGVVGMFVYPQYLGLVAMLTAVLLLETCRRLPEPGVAQGGGFRDAGAFAMGIYLAHPLWTFFLDLLHTEQRFPPLSATILYFGGGVLFSGLLTGVLLRFRGARVVVC